MTRFQNDGCRLKFVHGEALRYRKETYGSTKMREDAAPSYPEAVTLPVRERLWLPRGIRGTAALWKGDFSSLLDGA